MRITDINIDIKHITNGLKPLKMTKLNQCVLIAGKNGSGKSRLLTQITNILAQKPSKQMIHDAPSQIESYKNSIAQAKLNIGYHEQQILLNSQEKQNHEHNIYQQRLAIEQISEEIRNINDMINWSLIKTDYDYDNYFTISFVPKNTDIIDSSDYGINRLHNAAQMASSIGINQMAESAFAYIQMLQNRKFNATHPDMIVSQKDQCVASERYEYLEEIIYAFLGCKIGRDLDGQATIFGFQLAKSNLSDGQKVVLQYCIAIHAQEASLDDHILIMDEPENHLHPSILIELIEKIKKFNPKGQIWIATHSIPLLSYFDPHDIWYADDGLITKYGTVSEKVLESLLGNEERIEKLKDFINLSAIQAVNCYAHEALFSPRVANTNSNDPQTKQIHSITEEYIKLKGKVKILDYGAGKGRILNYKDDKAMSLKQVDYYAFDVSPENREDCICAISRFYTDAEERYFQNEKKLKSKHGEYSFDIVIMCNVLHEIDPLNWFGIFGPDGFITKQLKKTGVLLLVEDHQLPYGEKAYQKGFVVLDTPELRKLFDISNNDRRFDYNDFRNGGRLKAHKIPQSYLGKVTSETRKNALKELVRNAKKEILGLREKEPSYKHGRLSGFWMHQLCNAELTLDSL